MATLTEFLLERIAEDETWPNATFRDLAAVYSGHPEYDEAWRP